MLEHFSDKLFMVEIVENSAEISRLYFLSTLSEEESRESSGSCAERYRGKGTLSCEKSNSGCSREETRFREMSIGEKWRGSRRRDAMMMLSCEESV